MSRPRAKVGDRSFDFEFAGPQIKKPTTALGQEGEAARKLAALNKERELEARRSPGPSQPSRSRPYILDKARLRLLDIARIIRDKFDGPAITDDADLFLKVAAPSLMNAGGGPDTEGAEVEFLKFWERWTPGVSKAEGWEILREVERKALRKQRVHTNADEAAIALGITPEIMRRLNLKTVNAIGLNADQRTAEYREREKARQQANRDRNGCKRRADSKARTEPWKALGIGRSKFYELQKAGQLPVAPELVTTPEISPIGQDADCFVAIGSSEPHFAPTQESAGRQTDADPARRESPIRSRGADGHSPRSRIIAAVTDQTGAVLLPDGECGKQSDLFSLSSQAEPLSGRVSTGERATLEAFADFANWHEGQIPDVALAAIAAIAHANDLRTRSAVARAIGIERGTWSNAYHGRYGLGPDKVAKVKAWLTAA